MDESDAGDTGLWLAPTGKAPIAPSATADNPAAPATSLVVRLFRVIVPLLRFSSSMVDEPVPWENGLRSRDL
jgi:hypothetical protein